MQLVHAKYGSCRLNADLVAYMQLTPLEYGSCNPKGAGPGAEMQAPWPKGSSPGSNAGRGTLNIGPVA